MVRHDDEDRDRRVEMDGIVDAASKSIRRRYQSRVRGPEMSSDAGVPKGKSALELRRVGYVMVTTTLSRLRSDHDPIQRRCPQSTSTL
jgi:hypothetical protein